MGFQVDNPNINGSIVAVGTGTGIAAIALSGHRAVAVNATGQIIYADNTDLSLLNATIGVSHNAAAIGETVSYCTIGEIIEPAWNWTPQRSVFLDATGLLTQTPPQSGFLQVIGRAIAPTKLFVNPQPPIIRS